MRSSTISIQYSYVNIACMTLYCILIESLLSAHSITCDAYRTLTEQAIALCRVPVICQCSTATRYSLCAYGPHFIMVKFYRHFLSVICQISPINLRMFSKWFIQSRNHHRGVSKFLQILWKIRTKFRFKAVLKMPVRKAHQGRSNLFQNIFFSQIFLGTHLFSAFFCGNLKFLCKNQSQIALVSNFDSKSSNKYIISFP